jgi:hypothetical protein
MSASNANRPRHPRKHQATPTDHANFNEFLETVFNAIAGDDDRDEALENIMGRLSDETTLSEAQLQGLIPIMARLPDITDSMIACRALVRALKLLHANTPSEHAPFRKHVMEALHKRWSHMDVGWARVDAGYGIARDLAGFSKADAESIIAETDEIRKEWQIAAQPGASTYIACLRILIRTFSGLLPRQIDNQADLQALVALIDILPSYGERAALWADLAMRTILAGRSELATKITNSYLCPSFGKIPKEDSSYRSAVLIRIAPALYKAQPTSCLEEIEKLPSDHRDAALLQVARFLLWKRMPSDPVEHGSKTASETTHETLLQIEQLTHHISTDWMLYSIADDIAEAINSPKNKYTLTLPQREDISHRFTLIAQAKLPSSRHITHDGFKIAMLAQAARMTQTKPAAWRDLISSAELLDNVSDRIYVFQIIALCLPKNMDSESSRLLNSCDNDIPSIPWHLDQVERLLGLAEDLNGKDTPRCRGLISRAAETISKSTDDLRDQRRHLVDIAYRVDDDFAKQLIETFDDDEAKRRAQGQVRLLEVRRTITELEGRPSQEKLLGQVRGSEVHKLGMLFLRGLNAGRIQHFHPNEIREYIDLAANQPLSRAFPMLNWYVENAISRYAKSDQAVTFLRPLFDACVVGTQLAGQISGRSLIRLKALKQHSNELSNARSLLVTPESREDAIRVLDQWFERNLGDEVKIHDPYFGPDELCWLQQIRIANPKCVITVMTSRKHQPGQTAGTNLEDLYVETWQAQYDQLPPKAEIVIIGGERSKNSPIHDRWLVTNEAGLRFGSSLNSLGIAKESEISEMSGVDVEQKRAEMDSYLDREKTDYQGEKLRLIRFWL